MSDAADAGLIHLSKPAIENIRDILKDNDMDGYGLRFGIRGGGCSGYSYLLEFAEAPEADDAVTEIEGIPVFVGAFKRDFLQGTTIDYLTNEWESGFKINNPNARRPCGCGESFDIDEEKSG
ncbi:MAG: iron-sulfur cluster assembly accessory protein [Alphaproteobacteria bacterium]|nr:iron-sulfur cluster assembly accessory protein [Alphaproteobacteria bacterium]